MSNYIYQGKQCRVKIQRIFAFILVTISAIIILGTISAYYSDRFEDKATVEFSDLVIDGGYTYSLNGTAIESDGLSAIIPGDVIVITATIRNEGEQSAWIRERISFGTTEASILDYFVVYEGVFTQGQFLEDTAFADEYILPMDDNGNVVGKNKVIDGVGNAAPVAGDYTYLNDTEFNFQITIRFLETAGNETQKLSFELSVITEALQYVNNNATQPTEIAWGAVAA